MFLNISVCIYTCVGPSNNPKALYSIGLVIFSTRSSVFGELIRLDLHTQRVHRHYYYGLRVPNDPNKHYGIRSQKTMLPMVLGT